MNGMACNAHDSLGVSLALLIRHGRETSSLVLLCLVREGREAPLEGGDDYGLTGESITCVSWEYPVVGTDVRDQGEERSMPEPTFLADGILTVGSYAHEPGASARSPEGDRSEGPGQTFLALVTALTGGEALDLSVSASDSVSGADPDADFSDGVSLRSAAFVLVAEALAGVFFLVGAGLGAVDFFQVLVGAALAFAGPTWCFLVFLDPTTHWDQRRR